ncbi:MAG: CPBP family intramembrane metalloprotease [Chloroflexi bacterium]|nr:CPBP family intramembrane metalloprotease [Chloroflexota bacterium]
MSEQAENIQLPPELESPKPPVRFWGFWATAGFGLVIFITHSMVQLLVALGFLAVRLISDSSLGLTQLLKMATNGLLLSMAVFASAVVGLGLTIIFIKVRKNATVAEYLGLSRVSKKTILLLVGVTIALLALSEGVTRIVGKSSSTQFDINAYRTSVWPALLWVAAVVFAPAFEETFFRGFLFVGFLQSRLGAVGTIFLTALLWAALHIQYGYLGVTTVFGLGIALGIVRLKTGSLLAPLFMHSLWNLAAMTGTALYEVNALRSLPQG